MLAFSITASAQVVLTDWNTNETATTGKTVDGVFTKPKSIAIPSWPSDPSAVPDVTVAADPADANNQVIKFVRTTGTSLGNSLSIRWGATHDTDNDGANGPGTAPTGINIGGGTPRPYLKFSVYSVDKTDFALKVKFAQGSKPEWKGNVKVALNTWTDIEVHYDYSNAGVVAGSLDNLVWNTVLDIGFNVDEAASGETFYVKGLTAHTDSSYSAATVLQDMSNTSNNAAADVYGGFGGNNTAANTVVADPTDANNSVRQVDVTAGGDAWKGIFIRPQTHYMDLTSNPTVSLKIYSTTAAHFRGILQGGQSGQAAIDQATNTAAHGGTGWETLSFTFHGATGEWGEFAMRTSVDADGTLNNTTALTAYIDDLTAAQGSAIPVPAQPTTSPAAPTKEAEDVISIYSDAYTGVTVSNYNPNWNQTGSVSTNFDPGDGNNVMVYSNFNYQGTEFAATDMSAMEYMHIDIWVASDDTNTYQVTPIGAGETLVDITTTPGSWSSVDIPVTSFTAVNFSSVNQMKFAGGNGKSIYLDNIYFWKEPTAAGTDATLSDLAVDGTTISGFGASTSYSVPLVEGTTTIPQITAATTTDTNASAVITQATAIPGDATVVVTAGDGTTTATYTVSFFIGIPAAGPTAPTREASDVIAIYSDSYTAITTNHNPGWGQSGGVNTTFDAGDGNNLLVYSNFNYQGTEFPATDMSEMQFLHIDIFVAENDTRTVKVSPIGGGSETLVSVATTPGSWNSVDIPVSEFTNVNFSSVGQLKFDGQFASDGITADAAARSTIYLDNIYFYKEANNGGGGGTTPETTTYCETEVTHFNIEAETASTIVLTIENSGADKITVSATGVNSPIDLLFVGAPATGGTSSATTINDGVASFDITWAAGTMPETTTFELLWSTEANGGNWMLQSGTGEQGIGNINTSNDCSQLGIVDHPENTFMIYPNPVQNTLNVSAGAAVDSVSIFDITGREVLRATPNAATFSLDVATLNKGLYLVSLKAGDQEMTTKLVK